MPKSTMGLSRSTVRFLSAYLCFFSGALIVGAVLAGPPTPLIPPQTGLTTEPQPVGPVAVSPSVPQVPSAPAVAGPAQREGVVERAGRNVDGALVSTGQFLGSTAQSVGDGVGSAVTATGNAFDWVLRETGDLLKRGGESLQQLAE